jgi:hypothetical protein
LPGAARTALPASAERIKDSTNDRFLNVLLQRRSERRQILRISRNNLNRHASHFVG